MRHPRTRQEVGSSVATFPTATTLRVNLSQYLFLVLIRSVRAAQARHSPPSPAQASRRHPRVAAAWPGEPSHGGSVPAVWRGACAWSPTRVRRGDLVGSPMATRSCLRNLRTTTSSLRISPAHQLHLRTSSRPLPPTFAQLSRPSQLPHTRTMATQVDDRFLADAKPPVCSLNIKDAFAALTKEESK